MATRKVHQGMNSASVAVIARRMMNDAVKSVAYHQRGTSL